jgi:hypothetical protein
LPLLTKWERYSQQNGTLYTCTYISANGLERRAVRSPSIDVLIVLCTQPWIYSLIYLLDKFIEHQNLSYPFQNYRKAWYENNRPNKFIQFVPPLHNINVKNVLLFKAYRLKVINENKLN